MCIICCYNRCFYWFTPIFIGNSTGSTLYGIIFIIVRNIFVAIYYLSKYIESAAVKDSTAVLTYKFILDIVGRSLLNNCIYILFYIFHFVYGIQCKLHKNYLYLTCNYIWLNRFYLVKNYLCFYLSFW